MRALLYLAVAVPAVHPQLAGVEAVNLESGATETVLDGVPVPDIAAEEGGLVAVEVAGSILVFDTPA